MRREIICLCSFCALAGVCEQIIGDGKLAKTVRFLLGLESAMLICGLFLELKDMIFEVFP